MELPRLPSDANPSGESDSPHDRLQRSCGISLYTIIVVLVTRQKNRFSAESPFGRIFYGTTTQTGKDAYGLRFANSRDGRPEAAHHGSRHAGRIGYGRMGA